MPGLLLFVATLFVLLAIFGFLVMLKRPVYQLTELNVIRLLELVLAGEASADDWNVFVDIPIRYNDELEKLRICCAEISERHSKSHAPGFLFSEAGLQRIKELLDDLKKDSDAR